MTSAVSINQPATSSARENSADSSAGKSDGSGKSGGQELIIWNGPRLFHPDKLQQAFENATSVEDLLKSDEIWLVIGEAMMDSSLFDMNAAPDLASAMFYQKIDEGMVKGLNQYLSGFLSDMYKANPTSKMAELINGFSNALYSSYAAYGHFVDPCAGVTNSGDSSSGTSSDGGNDSSTSGPGSSSARGQAEKAV